MVKIQLRSLLLSTLFCVLSLYAVSLLSDKARLYNQNQRIQEESGHLTQVLMHLEQDHQQLLNGLKGNEKDAHNLKDALESLKKENESLQFSLKKNQASIESIKEEKSYLEEMLINKTKQIEILNGQKQPAQPAATEAPEETGAQGREQDLKRLNEQNRVLQEKLDRLYKTTNAKINEINIAKIALEETVSTAKKKIEDEWNTVNLGSVTTSAVADRPPQTSDGTTEPKSEGHVLAINNEHGFVVIDLGKVDNLPSDAQLEVRKDGQIIATLSVLEIRDVMAACNIKYVQNGQKIEINDSVSILR